jgi:hypothetical protein
VSEHILSNSTGCDTFKDLIQQELDAALSSDERERLALHLDRCASCEEYREKLIKLELGLAHITIDGPQATTAKLNLIEGIMPDLERIATTRAENARRKGVAENEKGFGRFGRLGQQTWFRRYGMAIAAAIVLMIPAGVILSDNLGGSNMEMDTFSARLGMKSAPPESPAVESSMGLQGADVDRYATGGTMPPDQGRVSDYTVRETGNELTVYNLGNEVFRTAGWLDGVRVDYQLLADDIMIYRLFSEDGKLLASYTVDLVTQTVEQINEADTEIELR